MSGSFPPGVIRHTYTAGFTIVPPSGSGLSNVPSSQSQSGDPNTNFDVSTTDSISSIGIGIYLMNLANSAVCSYAGTFFNDSGSSNSTLGFTPIQHNYSGRPLATACWISSFYDAVRAAGAHHAEDVIQDIDQNGHPTIPSYGDLVLSMKTNGVVDTVVSGQPNAPYPGCLQGNPRPPGDYVKVKEADGYYTIYYHVTPAVSVGQKIYGSTIIGYLDNSGCQSAAHLHVGRKDSNGHAVNFTIPCTNQLPTKQYYDGLVDDAVPDNL